MSKYLIKKMETSDEIDGKCYVHYKSWHETYTNLIDDEYLNSITLEECSKRTNLSTDQVLIAKDGDKVIGFVGYGACRYSSFINCGEVYSLYVLHEYQGQQVGYALMNAAIKRLCGYKEIAIWVLKGNDNAIHFYEKYGFHQDGCEQELTLGTPCTVKRMIYSL